jgi:hypothetical protein
MTKLSRFSFSMDFNYFKYVHAAGTACVRQRTEVGR